MARGIGGEDGPSVWMFLTVILVWAWVKSTFTSAKNSVVDTLEIGKNSGGPFQSESTADIDRKNRFIDKIPVTHTRLPHSSQHYRDIADMLQSELTATFNTDEPKMFAALTPLSLYELRAVAKAFGVRENSVGFTYYTYTLFDIMTKVLSGSDLTRMRKIWAKTGLWD